MKHKFIYTGPIYHNGIKICECSNMITYAVSFKQARNQLLYRIADGDYTTHYDIVDRYLTMLQDDTIEVEPTRVYDYCPECGEVLNDMGQCPVCEQGEEDI